MNEQTDSQLLRSYADSRSEEAFVLLTRRYVDMVYSASFRMIRDPHLAEDVTQGVFVALAKSANQLADRPVLSGWLHCTARNIAAQTVRTIERRRTREREAANMNELLATGTEASWDEIAPHLDAALGELSEPDRDALLLRYFERKSAREMAQLLGISDEAAQKRVNRAENRLRDIFSKQGIAIGTAGLMGLVSVHAVQSAPAGLIAAISTAVGSPAMSFAAAAVSTTKTVTVTTIQKTLLATAFAIAVGTGIFEATRATGLQQQLNALHGRAPEDRGQQWQRETDEAQKQLIALEKENESLRQQALEIHKLRNVAGQMLNATQELARLKSGQLDPAVSEATAWQERVQLLKKHFAENPQQRIPEIELLSETDWLAAAKGKLDSEAAYRQAMSAIRHAGETRVAQILQPALTQYIKEHNGQFPSQLSELRQYFTSPLSDVILNRYAMIPANEMDSLNLGGDWIITQKGPIDADMDSRFGIGPNGYGSTGSQGWQDSLGKSINILKPVLKAYAADHAGKSWPEDLADLKPYLKTPEQESAYLKTEKAFANAKANRDSKKQ